MKTPVFRKDKILTYCRDKSVLHLGFVQHKLYPQRIEENDWLHAKIAAVASRVVGFDYLEEDVRIIREKYGYEGYFADVMALAEVPLSEKFDVIVAGELIEHVENPGLMLDGLKRFMHKDSLLLITTPNPWSKARMKLMRRGELEKDWLNPEHVAWYSHQTLKQLLERKGFAEIEYTYYYAENSKDFYDFPRNLGGIFRFIKRYLGMLLTREHLCDGLFFACKVRED